MKLEKHIADEVLLKQSLEGNEFAFTQLYRRYSKKIYSFVYTILNSEVLAEEVMHEIMIKVWNLGKTGEEIRNFESYIKVAAKNKALNALRKLELDRRTLEEGTLGWSDAHEDTEETIMLNDAKKLLNEAIALLPPQQQKVFKLCHLDGLKYEEAAQVMGLSAQTIGTHMKLALKFVRMYIKTASSMFVFLLILKLV